MPRYIDSHAAGGVSAELAPRSSATPCSREVISIDSMRCASLPVVESANASAGMLYEQ